MCLFFPLMLLGIIAMFLTVLLLGFVVNMTSLNVGKISFYLQYFTVPMDRFAEVPILRPYLLNACSMHLYSENTI